MCFVALENTSSPDLESPSRSPVGDIEVYGALGSFGPYMVKLIAVFAITFSVEVGFQRGCPLCLTLFVIFMNRISMCRWVVRRERVGNLRLAYLLFADEVVRLTSLVCEI